MRPAAAAQLAFAAEFATFLVSLAGVASAARLGVLTRRRSWRPILVAGFGAFALAAFLRGALVVADPQATGLAALRLFGGLALFVGLWRWRGRRSRYALLVGLVAFAVAGVGLWTDHQQLGDVCRLAGAAAFTVALVSAARRSISTRIAVDAAVLVLGVVLLVAIAVSVTVSENVDREAFGRYTARAASEADDAAAEARVGLGSARIVAGVLASERADVLDRAGAGVPAPEDAAALDAALAALTDARLLDLPEPVVLLGASGAPVAAVPASFPVATRLALAGDPVVREAREAGTERQAVTVVGGEAFAVSAAPVVIRPDGSPQRVAGLVVVARRLDDRYLKVLGTGGESLSFSFATPSRVVATSGSAAEADDARPVVDRVVASGRAARTRRGDRFVAVAPVRGAETRPVLAFVVTAPGTAAADTQRDLFRVLFVVALGSALSAVVLAFLVGERIGKGLGRLTDAARAMQAGALDTDVRVRSGDELGVLGEAFTSMAGSIRLMTDELRAVAADEAALRARLQAVVSGMSESLVAIDHRGRVIEVNVAAEDLLDVDRDDAVGRPVTELVRWRLVDGRAVAMDRADLPDGQPMAADVAVGDGSVPVVVTAGSLLDEDGGDAGAVLVFRDVRSERQVEDLKSSILSNISHELRTPLTPIKGYAGMLRDRPVDEARTRMFAGQIVEGVDQLERVVRQLVTFATINAGHLELERTPVPVGDLADAVTGRWAGRIDAPHEFSVAVDEEIGATTVDVDEALLAQAVDELIDNAVKYSPDGGPVTVRCTRVSGEPMVRVAVTDTGIGIPGERLANLSDPFIQLDGSATRRFGGLGLGLACADRIVRAHGGRLDYATNGQQGSIVSILIPIVRRPSEAG